MTSQGSFTRASTGWGTTAAPRALCKTWSTRRLVLIVLISIVVVAALVVLIWQLEKHDVMNVFSPMSLTKAEARNVVTIKRIPQDDLDELHRMVVALDYAVSKVGKQYWLACGSVLGAMRHKGFMPWDYDFDSQMWADDYEESKDAMRVYLEEVGYTFDEHTPFEGLMGRVVRTGKTFFNTKLHMDIFTLDRKTGYPLKMDEASHGRFPCLEPGVNNIGTPRYVPFGVLRLPVPEHSKRVVAKVYGPKWEYEVKGKNQKLDLNMRRISVGRRLPRANFMDGEHHLLIEHYNKKLKI